MMYLPESHIGPYPAGEKNPVATVERVDNGFMIELHDMVEVGPPPGEMMEFAGPDGTPAGSMRTAAPYMPRMQPRARKFIARDLDEMQSRLADFFGDTAPHSHDQQQR